ncbi:hypothetical protein Gasu2_69410 [Galdieria sulphuraria]|uniref:Transmembrane protein 14 n=1 Tax=Galdieria sulphuraria TaxID=130081 RepID=M2XHH4_GALSU|nr:uncharacterized protein Gasu_29760 [Galdieria sulphuraria]EME29532.1 hypothetical protein Gasu_29760 [Galdieria sulphuraria]GJD12875.1 hypothetical protein Gasu2_69410 [Galdieria sulphuraria]|eukprot:XP_005706052.1 hypothetical protein Gasu_29760 [Galdieria sulphuraria]
MFKWSKSWTALFHKPEQLLLNNNNNFFARYQKFSVATLKDVNIILYTKAYKERNQGKLDVLSSTPSASKRVPSRILHTVAASSGASLPDLWNSVTLTYGSLIAAGGITGYVRTRSIPSLLSGIISAALLFVSWHQNSPPLAFAVSSFLTAAFFMRFRKTKKIYPSGILGVISVAASAFFGYVYYYWT